MMTDDRKQLVENENEILYLASDGGLADDNGSFSAVISTATHIIATAQGRTPYSPEMNSSFRSESYGMLAGLVLLQGLVASYDIKMPPGRKLP
jgi:hypothetical protein